IGAESYRFPEIYVAAYETGTKPLVDVVTGLLRRHAALGAVRATRYDLAALAFLSLVVGGPARLAAAGAPLSDRAIEARVAFNVELFLRGVAAPAKTKGRRRSAAAATRNGRLQ
ncbi:MAG: TetR/AcrR family transcriptional regulator C-terminal domain-containing protein, partial [Parvularculaceae bacterium]|nr:TetR/AcrR family transcriptional regulator C-terminal domain-containing protein [Parvularculaceae bacterium]